MNNNFFTPIMDYKKHKENWPKSFFSSDGIYCENNNSWYLNQSHPTKYFHNYNDFLNFCFVDPLIPRYITFATGASYIVPKENILKLPKIFYENLKTFVSHCSYAIPGESHIIERSLHTIWNCNFELNEKMLKPIDKNFIAMPKLINKTIILPQKSFISKTISRLPFGLKEFIKNIISKLPTILQKLIFKIVNGSTEQIKNTLTPIEERKLFDLLKNELDIVFDIGTRDELSFYKMKNNCEYHLFEPNIHFVNLLKKQISLFKNHKIKLNEYGLSDIEASNCIYYEKSQSFIINPVLKEDTASSYKYSVSQLDKYVRQNNIPKIDFLKIDTEGLDYKVMLGGLNTIKHKVSYIQFEYWDGVKKFVDILDNFNLYLMIESVLLKAILEKITPSMNQEQKKINYKKSIISLDENIINLIDKHLIPNGYGGNIFGVNSNIKHLNINKLIFDVS